MISQVIAVDFDGTLCENKWPDIGRPNEWLIEFIKTQRANGHKIILWTCREEWRLDQAIQWCKSHGLEFDEVNQNLKERIELYGNNCRKVSADLYIDDKAINAFWGYQPNEQ